MITAIQQPNFFPWLGYFHKMVVADQFVFLDAVQLIKTKGSWTNRVKLIVGKKPRWLTVPVVRGPGYQDINKVIIQDGIPWRKKALSTLHHNYNKCEFYNDLIPWVQSMFSNPTQYLADFNIDNIKKILDKLGLRCMCYRQSDMKGSGIYNKRGSERLSAICKQTNAEIYLAGDGAKSYENENAYTKDGIRLIYNNFVPQPYPQLGRKDFVPGLSILDALFNLGLEKTSHLLQRH